MIVRNIHLRLASCVMIPLVMAQQNLSQFDYAIFKNLYQFFELPLSSDYYKVMTMSDGKYKLIIRYDEPLDMYDIKYTIEDKIYSKAFA